MFTRKTLIGIGVSIITLGTTRLRINNLKSALKAAEARADFWERSFDCCIKHMTAEQASHALQTMRNRQQFDHIVKNF